MAKTDTDMDSAEGIYRGRLMCDGQGNLLADESKRVGDKVVTVYDENGNPMLDGNGMEMTVHVPMFRYGNNHNRPVALHEGSYVFVGEGEASHNERHHQKFVTFEGTTDESIEGQEHHLSPMKDDPHYDADTDNHTRLRFSPDKVAATETSHTDAYEGKHELPSKGDKS
jgi:hypothetical protein